MDWPHAPPHWLFTPGIFMVTGATYRKAHHLSSPDRLDGFHASLLGLAGEFGWELRAWAVLSNHYHFVAQSPDDPGNLSRFIGKLHGNSSRELNRLDASPERRAWYQFWDSRITYERSYLARLQYVHQNPVRHGVIPNAENYPWCSADWFARTAPASFVATVKSFKIDRLNVYDDF